MSDGMLVVQFGALQQASADIQKALNKLEQQLGQLEQDAAPLVASWDGEAKQAYEQRQAKWRNASQDLQSMLRDIKTAVDESVSEYMVTERHNTSLFNS